MKKLLSLFISGALLAIIYWRIDFGRLLPVFARADPLWMPLALAMVVPLTLLTSWRLQQLMPRPSQLGFAEANKLILVASVLNLILPSKMGDIAKAWFMRDRGHLQGTLALSLVVFEKACDMLSLLLWCVFGLAWVGWSGGQPMRAFDPATWATQLGLVPPSWMGRSNLFSLCLIVVASALAFGLLLLGSQKCADFFFQTMARLAPAGIAAKLLKMANSWSEMHNYFWASKARLATVTLTSVFIWFLHLLQIWLFILALKVWTPFFANLALSPLAILAGLLPLTMAGVGTRDAALVLFYAPYFDAPTAAVLGILCTARYLLPAIGGLPFAASYLQRARELAPTRTAAVL